MNIRKENQHLNGLNQHHLANWTHTELFNGTDVCIFTLFRCCYTYSSAKNTPFWRFTYTYMIGLLKSRSDILRLKSQPTSTRLPAIFFKSSLPLRLFREQVRPISCVSVPASLLLKKQIKSLPLCQICTLITLKIARKDFHSAATSLVVSAHLQAFISKFTLTQVCKKWLRQDSRLLMLRDKEMKSNPNVNHTHLALHCSKEESLSIPVSLSDLLTLKWSTSCRRVCQRVVKTTFSRCVCAEVSDKRGVCVHMHAQLFSLARHLVEIDGEKCPIRRKLTWCFKTRMHIYEQKKNKTILTSLGRGSLVFGWTWALECSLWGGCWWSHGSSIAPPDW